MKLKEEKYNKRIYNNIFKFIKNKKIIIWILVLGLYTGLLLISGIQLHKKGISKEIKRWVVSAPRIPKNYITSLFTNPENITIDIKFEDFQKIAYNRNIALHRGYLAADCRDEVPADIRYKDKLVQVKLRLKGDFGDHWEDEKKWSFRIKVIGDNTLFGMKEFNIQHPKTRNYIWEWLFHKVLKRENIPYLRYKFIKVKLNGKNLGVYALEESFEKRLIENNQLREGPIIKLDESLHFEKFWRFIVPFPNAEASGYGYFSTLPLDAFQTRKTISDTTTYSQFIKAISLFESVRNGELELYKAFDVKKFATYFAITDILGARHGSGAGRFYYNPVTLLIEPIGFDGEAGMMFGTLCAINDKIFFNDTPYWLKNGEKNVYNNYKAMMFSDELFYQEYLGELERVSNRSYLDSLFWDIEEELQKNLNIIYSEFPNYSFNKNMIYNNLKYIKEILNPVKCFHAYLHSFSEGKIELELGNIQYLPVEILNISYKDSLISQPNNKILLTEKSPENPTKYINISFSLPKGFVFSDKMVTDLRVNYRILGTNRLRSENVFPWSHLDYNLVNDIIRQPSNIENFDLLFIDENSKRIFFKSGYWNLKENLIIPKGYQVIANEGLRLDISNSALILTCSPITFVGSEENYISVFSSDSTGQGIVIMNANSTSRLKYVHFENLSFPCQKGWELTGAITFYESPVDIDNCYFSDNKRGDDYLNIIRTKFKIDNTIFYNVVADAFDADFCDGSIKNSKFINLGNDAIDISGTLIELSHIIIDNAEDKGLSVGENSNMFADNIEIKNSEIAVTSKDNSDIHIENSMLFNNQLDYAVFQKKSEFGPARITLNNVKVKDIEKYLVEENSILSINNKIIKSNSKNVKNILYGNQYGKASR